MKTRHLNEDSEKILRDVDAALRRAALRARQIAAQTNTHLIIVRDGQIVRETVTAESLQKITELISKDAAAAAESPADTHSPD